MILLLFEVVFFFFLLFSVLVQQPLSLGGSLLLLSFLSRVYVSVFFSSWFCFSVFLIYIGGMLVLFGYVMVLVPNFVFRIKGIYLFIFLFLFFFFSFWCFQFFGRGL